MSPPFLADESCDFGIVRALRADGYQGTAVSEAAPGADDSVVIDLANRAKSILITEDKDFDSSSMPPDMKVSAFCSCATHLFHARKSLKT